MLGNWFGKLVVTNLHRTILELRFWSLFQAGGAATPMVWSPSRWSAVQWCFGYPIHPENSPQIHWVHCKPRILGGEVFSHMSFGLGWQERLSRSPQRLGRWGTSWNARPRPALLGPPTPCGAWGKRRVWWGSCEKDGKSSVIWRESMKIKWQPV